MHIELVSPFLFPKRSSGIQCVALNAVSPSSPSTRGCRFHGWWSKPNQDYHQPSLSIRRLVEVPLMARYHCFLTMLFSRHSARASVSRDPGKTEEISIPTQGNISIKPLMLHAIKNLRIRHALLANERSNPDRLQVRLPHHWGLPLL